MFGTVFLPLHIPVNTLVQNTKIRKTHDTVTYCIARLLILHSNCAVTLYCVDLEVWSKLAKCVRIMRIASKYACDFKCDWQRVNTFSPCVTLIRVLLPQIISYSDTKVPVLVIMECKRANANYVYELIYLLHTLRSTECRVAVLLPLE